ncbi:MAG: DNA topoisomerase VI subunit B [Phycisphaerales bacterium]
MKNKAAPRATAESMAAKQRDISVSEFFAKNRHLLGFDSPRKALLTAVKEAVDNSLDACEEAGILPDVTVVIEDLEEGTKAGKEEGTKARRDGGTKEEGKAAKAAKSSRYRVTVVDNGPGILRKQVENVFGRLLFGSKFHRLKMSRGQQGIGISAAGMYGLITTGKPMMIQTRPDAKKKAHHIELAMNTKTNRAEVTVDEETDDFPLARLRNLNSAVRELAEKGEVLSAADYPTGTSVTIELEGKYQRGRGSVDEFLELTAIANPHARITFVRPTRTVEEEEDAPLLKGRGTGDRALGTGAGTSGAPVAEGPVADAPGSLNLAAVTTDLGSLVVFPRAVAELPPETREIQPHPKGIELGILLQMLKDFQEANKGGGTLYNFLQECFCRVSAATASEFCHKVGCTTRTKVSDVESPQAEKLFKAFQEARLAPPPTDCLAPIGVQQLLKGMFKGVRAEFYAASSREADVYRGRPFLIETAIAFGGELPADDTARVIRFANRVPLLFQQSACSSFKAVGETNWRNYDLQHPRNSLPVGPLVIMIHMASVWVPFTSESKEAIADYDEIRKEMKLALMECGRKLGTYLRKRLKMRREGERRDVFERYIGEIAKAINAINGTDAKKLYDALLVQARKRTAIADLQLNDEGKAQKDDDPADSEGVIIVGPGAAPLSPPAGAAAERATEGPPGKKSAGKRRIATTDDTPPLTFSKAELAQVELAAGAKGVGVPKAAASNPRKPTATSKAEAKAAPKAKPKMRLVNGKLIPVDEPGLF